MYEIFLSTDHVNLKSYPATTETTVNYKHIVSYSYL